ncbi:hypothetical protein L198_01088 [Cryptococcus wingfieldii CBS 7118]|uniref:Uncharacterized protein n=1 Tax=Cryptococcus wingfieldii CBS 7118 TaxID=1295528 RepID=A0A1E3K397_9TREE|nr:hypothetical protein L198_01088 [Cryptococcus wingfieldii CBS 7118]ODO07509.1 hypothetical protein L198_01088 [Cryptococcus wingfieldii CBS 7118]
MKAARRVLWSSHAELSELYDYLFAPGADLDSRRRGLARMSIYISSPSCPAFIHLLHSLVAAELLPFPPPRGAEESQRMRMMMAMAIVRFVNGLVDPLQTGSYARPISHLAASLGLPPSLIALRHRATHEDLPPLPLLQQAIAQCIFYLHQNSFLPLLSLSYNNGQNLNGVMSERDVLAKKRIDSLLRRWKKVMKTRLREKEVREEDVSGLEMRKVRRDLEGEVSGVDGIIKSLIEVGSLVPLAKRQVKRASPQSSLPPTPSLKIWLPLLTHLSATTPSFPSFLATSILDLLLNPSDLSTNLPAGRLGFNAQAEMITLGEQQEDDAREEEESYRWGLGVWVLYLWREDAEVEGALGLDAEEKTILYRRLAIALLHKHDDQILVRLHESLANIDENLYDVINSLSSALPDPEEDKGLDGLAMDVDDDELEKGLGEMEKRLAEFERQNPPARQAPRETTSRPSDSLPGWKRLTTEEWTPSPIGSAMA